MWGNVMQISLLFCSEKVFEPDGLYHFTTNVCLSWLYIVPVISVRVQLNHEKLFLINWCHLL